MPSALPRAPAPRTLVLYIGERMRTQGTDPPAQGELRKVMDSHECWSTLPSVLPRAPAPRADGLCIGEHMQVANAARDRPASTGGAPPQKKPFYFIQGPPEAARPCQPEEPHAWTGTVFMIQGMSPVPVAFISHGLLTPDSRPANSRAPRRPPELASRKNSRPA